MRKPHRPHRRPAPRRGGAPQPSGVVELDVLSLGGRGDGVGRLEGRPVFVPYTVPGDRIVARLEGVRGEGMAASLIEVLEPGPDRVAAPCPLYGRCGGCSVQHMSAESYDAWKRDLLLQPLARVGLDGVPVAPLLRVPDGARRRASFALARVGKTTVIGFNARASHTVLDLETCLLLEPALCEVLPRLRPVLASVIPPSRGGDITVTLTESGLDILVEAEAGLDLFARETLARLAEDADLARLSWRRPGDAFAEPLSRRRSPRVQFGDVAVEPPPGAFLQPSREGEQAILRILMEGIPPNIALADLYAGCGSFTLPLARRSAVRAVEGEQSALAALELGARAARLPVVTEMRDLARRPLEPFELTAFGAVVMDPPRAGAAAQAAALALPPPPKGGPRHLAMVSCNPTTLARDLRVLVDGGWQVRHITPLDQFPYSSHLESVALLYR